MTVSTTKRSRGQSAGRGLNAAVVFLVLVAFGPAQVGAGQGVIILPDSTCLPWEFLPACSEGRTAEINGIQLYYEVWGDGEPLLLLHGSGGSGEHFNWMLPQLARSYRVIVPDLRAQGRSTDTDEPLSYEGFAEDIVDLLDSLGIESAFVGGWSGGAAAAIHLAIHHPQRVRALLLTAVDLSPDALTATFWKDAEQWEWPEKLRAFQLETAVKPEDAELAAIRAPSLFVLGRREQYIEPDHLAWQYESIPDAKVVWIPEGDHLLPLNQPADLTDAFMAFLREIR